MVICLASALSSAHTIQHGHHGVLGFRKRSTSRLVLGLSNANGGEETHRSQTLYRINNATARISGSEAGLVTTQKQELIWNIPTHFLRDYDFPLVSTTDIPVQEQREIAPSKKGMSNLDRFWKRLDTQEDKMDMHKLSSVAYLLSAFGILIIGSSAEWSNIPKVLEGPTWIFMISCWVQSVTSIEMTLRYRATDPHVRNGFLASAWNMISMAWALLYVSPFAPDAFNNFYIGNGILAATFLPILFYDIHGVANLRNIINNRTIRNNEPGGDLGRLGDALSYGLGATVGLVFVFVSIPMVCDPSHDRSWLMEANSSGKLPCGDHFVAYNYYCNVLGTLAVAGGAFATTLRDRKLWSKQTEQLVMGIPLVIFLLGQLRNYGIIGE